MESRLEIYKCLSLILLFLGISLDCYCFFLNIYIFLDIGEGEMMRVMRGSVSLRVAKSDVGTLYQMFS